ncbi:MAG: hypothetical protein WCQ63_01750 [Methanomethylophilus sp.]|nr:hypothetical protein [Methanomethylophilus sp.]
MRLKHDRRAITAVVDAMIFIILMGLAVAVISLTDGPPPGPTQEAADVADAVFLGNATPAEYGLDADGGAYTIADLTAASLTLDDGSAETFLTQVLDAACGRPNTYSLTVTAPGGTLTLGSGCGTPVSGYKTDYLLTYGGDLHVVLELY